MKIIIYILEFVVLLGLLYGLYLLINDKKVKNVKKSTSIIPKIGSDVVINDKFEGTVVGYKDDKIVVEVIIDIDDISR